ncbi:MAG TPA: glycerophosphoryl diester phosphodiesterase membrane domain-containing protein [Actinomycetota bacterium]|nr:glycerophosphoryl diester phosphodiesterase membrane domain-containing protein [Actinomycetota bacterium]
MADGRGQPQLGAWEGAVFTDYIGVRHVLGRTADAYGIWPLAGGTALRRFPLTHDGWADAWRAYQDLEAPVAPVPPSTWRRGHPIRLGPMRAGQVIGGAFRLYRMYFSTLLGVVAPAMLGFYAIVVYANWVTARTVSIQGFRVVEVPEWVNVVTNILYAAVTQFVTAAAAKTAVDAFRGRETTLGTAYRFAFPLIFPVGWVFILLIVVLLLPLLPGILLTVGAAGAGDAGLAAAGALAMLVGVVVALFLAIRLIFSSLAVVLEGHRGGRALRRSWRLSRGVAWRIFGVLILSFLIILGVQLVVLIPLLVPIVSGATEITRANLAVINAANGLVATLLTPFFSVVTILLYADARLRKEEPDPERLWAAVP